MVPLVGNHVFISFDIVCLLILLQTLIIFKKMMNLPIK